MINRYLFIAFFILSVPLWGVRPPIQRALSYSKHFFPKLLKHDEALRRPPTKVSYERKERSYFSFSEGNGGFCEVSICYPQDEKVAAREGLERFLEVALQERCHRLMSSPPELSIDTVGDALVIKGKCVDRDAVATLDGIFQALESFDQFGLIEEEWKKGKEKAPLLMVESSLEMESWMQSYFGKKHPLIDIAFSSDLSSLALESLRRWIHKDPVGLDPYTFPPLPCKNSQEKTRFTKKAKEETVSFNKEYGDEERLQLMVNDKEGSLITKLITTLADSNVFTLLRKQREVKRLGKKVDHIHPFHFLGYIFSDPILKQKMRTIRGNPFKWKGFLNGFSKRIQLEANHGTLYPIIGEFSNLVRAEEERLREKVGSSDWNGFMHVLIYSD